MNTWLSWWRADERPVQGLRALLRRGTRFSQHLFSVVGCGAVVLALALWLLPTWRGMLAARLMPFVSAAVQAGPARLLQGNPLPSFGPPGAAQDDDEADGSTLPVALAPAAHRSSAGSVVASGSASGSARTAPGTATLDAVALNGINSTSLPSVAALARMIPTQRIAPDARDDRILVSEREQVRVATFIARRYHVAQGPVSALVKAAFDTGREVGLDPLLLLAVMAIESGFNPYAESGVGAQGLMQVMAKVHSDKFQYFGGQRAALDPLANIKVGALVLKDCIARGGSVPGGLRLYVGSTSPDDGGYGAKVMAERGRLRDVARGLDVSIYAPQAPVQTQTAMVKVSAQKSGAAKRVQVTLDGARPIVEKPVVTPVKASAEQDDASTSAHKRGSGSELGA